MHTTRSVRQRAARLVARFLKRHGDGAGNELARVLGVTRQAVSLWRAGKRLPSAGASKVIVERLTKGAA